MRVRMTLATFVQVFMFIWLGIVGAASIAFISGALNGSEMSFTTLIPVFMFVFGVVLSVGGFKYESAKARKNLAKLFEATIE